MTIDFGAVADLRDEYNNVFLDSQMLISDRMKYAGELPKVLGNFDRLAREIAQISDQMDAATCQCSDMECVSCEALNRLALLAEAYRARRAYEG